MSGPDDLIGMFGEALGSLGTQTQINKFQLALEIVRLSLENKKTPRQIIALVREAMRELK